VDVLFAEAEYSPRVLEVLRREAGTAVHRLSHLSAGEYTPDSFERGMARNLDAIVAALQEAQP
jgi:zinc transport system substrate-binding protein